MVFFIYGTISLKNQSTRNELRTIPHVSVNGHHRLCAVKTWVKVHRRILELSTRWAFEEKDVNDEPLNWVVEHLGKQPDASWWIEVKLVQVLCSVLMNCLQKLHEPIQAVFQFIIGRCRESRKIYCSMFTPKARSVAILCSVFSY